MIIKRQNLTDGSCNFCKRGVYEDGSKLGLVYPYKEVTQISTNGSGVSIRLCDECLREVKAI